jgi:hypothetical protein
MVIAAIEVGVGMAVEREFSFTGIWARGEYVETFRIFHIVYA